MANHILLLPVLVACVGVGFVWSQGEGQLRPEEVFQAYSPGQYVQQPQQLVPNKNGQLVRAYPASSLKRLRLVPVPANEAQQVLYGLPPGQGQLVDPNARLYGDPQGVGLDGKVGHKKPIPHVRPQLKQIPLATPHRLRAIAQQSPEAAELEEEYPADPNPQYNFSFDVKDDELTNYQNRQEERDGGVIKGSYSVVDPDGYVRTVTYTADSKNGFQAKVVREPTDVKIKFPVPTESPEEENKPLKAKVPLRLQQYPQYYVADEQSQVYRHPQAQLPQLQNPHLLRRPINANQ